MKERLPIYVTQPSLAPLEEYVAYLHKIWETGVMTHNGPLMQQLEREITAYEDVPDTICVANGTCAMQLAVRALDLEGEIITTPFSFIATANIITWEKCTPVFVDIEPDSWNIDAKKIEEAITDKTTAILPVHVFSAPCDVDNIKQLAENFNLKVIYDAAHAMTVKVKGKSIMKYGDVACTSFHATKLFNTGEGGACYTGNKELASRIRRMRFFGFDENKDVVDKGMNAKMTEIAAALGLVNLIHLDEVLKNRRNKYELYQHILSNKSYITFQRFEPEEYNYSYMPVLFDTEDRLLKTLKRLADNSVYPRRYFHPALNKLNIFNYKKFPIAEEISSRVVCLPLYNSLSEEEIINICQLI